jgi:hypothetical protein
MKSWFSLFLAISLLSIACDDTDSSGNSDSSGSSGSSDSNDMAGTEIASTVELRSCSSEVAPCITCSKNTDCFVNQFMSDQKQSWMQACGASDLCVECLGDDDDFSCGVNTFSLGPKCVNNFCGCDDTVTCTGNINGWKCLSTEGKSYCGCETNDDCGLTGFPCVDNPYVGGKTCKNAVWPE